VAELMNIASRYQVKIYVVLLIRNVQHDTLLTVDVRVRFIIFTICRVFHIEFD
jgi:hypothetical protein